MLKGSNGLDEVEDIGEFFLEIVGRFGGDDLPGFFDEFLAEGGAVLVVVEGAGGDRPIFRFDDFGDREGP